MSYAVGGAFLGYLFGGPLGLLIGVGAGHSTDVAQDQQRAQHEAENTKNALNADIERRTAQEETQQHISDNNTDVALGQIFAQEFTMRQASADRETQLAANLELGIEKLDNKLQIAKLEFNAQMTAEQNKHVEKIAEAELKFLDLQKGRADAYEGIPAPSSDDFLA